MYIMGINKHLSAAAPEKEFTLILVGANGCDLSFGRLGNVTIRLIKTNNVHNFCRVAMV
jgi:hypothetical protein